MAKNPIPIAPKGSIVTSYRRLDEIVKALRVIGAKIVLTQGTFDLVHIGHFLYLEQARALGDILIVGVDSDEKVRQRKGPDRPVVGEEERLNTLTHVRHVDYVTLKPANVPKWQLIKLIRPDVLVVTEDSYTPEQVEELRTYCKDVVVLDRQATTSTSSKIRQLNMGLSKKMREAVMKTINETFEKMLEQ